MKSSLHNFAHLAREPDERHARAACAAAWHEQGIAAFNPEWFTGWGDKKQAIILAEKLYGKRKDGADGKSKQEKGSAKAKPQSAS
jgi:hypothetical protein